MPPRGLLERTRIFRAASALLIRHALHYKRAHMPRGRQHPANAIGSARPKYPTKTIGCRRETQAALDALRGRFATAGQGVRSETAVIAEALRRWLGQAARDRK